jgi:hypothetical protein
MPDPSFGVAKPNVRETGPMIVDGDDRAHF